ncbi:hypothetical protein KIW84_013532 [Lathyrus oleraceus]|uniref:Rab-GAP TBC domain-containing protein n=1 Tax=Pisum sativum TaxID=3888 RepID=A0A9D5BKE2_PEA|nr:hypothetical protein KIW84_013532 [Pisum sativum]
MKTNKTSNPVITFDHKRDAYGFTVRPQHLQRYREYANIYKEEEEERSEKWKSFLDRQAETESSELASAVGEDEKVSGDEVVGEEVDASLEKGVDGHQTSGHVPGSEDSTIENGSQKEELPASEVTKIHRVQLWSTIRSSLHIIEDMMSARVKKKTASVKDERNKNGVSKDEKIAETEKSLSHSDDAKSPKGAFEEDSEDEFYDVERSDPSPDSPRVDGLSTSANGIAADAAPLQVPCPWIEELEVLVRGGVPMALRGELWQAFVGVKARRVDKYYQNLLASNGDSEIKSNHQNLQLDDNDGKINAELIHVPEKWKGQIEKDLPRTFPGHPALDEDGRNALRRLLTAYARHNPSVGYCQAMNFFAGLLLLLMPEENAFWTLMGILDDYFDGYFSEDMIESQVDQLVFEELVRERFPNWVCITQSSGLSRSAGCMGYWTMGHQQDNGWACGYYVMKNMFDIIDACIVERFNEIFTDTSSYEKESIDHIRQLWAQFFLQKVEEQENQEKKDLMTKQKRLKKTYI